MRGEDEILAPNEIFFEMVERGQEKVRTRTLGLQAAFEGLSGLSSKIATRRSLSP